MAGWIDEQGGTVQSFDGRLQVTIPPGAFRARRQVTITDLASGPTPPVAGVPIRTTRAFRLRAVDETGQDDTTPFGKPVHLTLQIQPSDLLRTIAPEGALYWNDPSKRTWVRLSADYDRRTMVLSADLPHFSDYLAGVLDNVSTLPSIDGFATDLCQGTSSVTVPLKVPPGPHGFAPKLTLAYSSGGPSGVVSEDHSTYEKGQGSWVGFGWDLDPGHILLTGWMAWNQRCYLNLNGRSYPLIALQDSAETWQTQTDEFLWIKMVNDTDYQNSSGQPWPYILMRAKDGTEYRFGYETAFSDPNGINYYNPTGSRSDAYWGDSQGNGHWLPVRFNLDQVTDTHGNKITINYTSIQATAPKNNGTITFDKWVYPTEILYSSGDNGGGGYGLRKISLNLRSGRTDGNPNMGQYLDQLLDSIDEYVQINGTWTLVRKYVFQYGYVTYNAATYGSDVKTEDLVLTGLIECDGTATPGVCNGVASGNTLPAMAFQYAIYNGWIGNTQYNPPRYCPLPLLSQVTNGYGGAVQYSYTANTYRSTGEFSTAQTQWWSVGSRIVQDGRGNSDTTTYQHGVGPAAGYLAGFSSKWEVPPQLNYPMWRGFNYTAEILPTGQVTEYRFFRGLSGPTTYNVNRSDGQTFGDSEPLAGNLYEVRSFESQGAFNNFGGTSPTGSTWSVWTIASTTSYTPQIPSGVSDAEDWNVYVAFQTAEQTNRQGSYHLRTFAYETQYGNLTDIYDYDTTTGAWLRHVKRWHFPGNDTANFNVNTNPTSDHYVADRLGAENVYAYGSGDGALLQSTWYCYDGSYAWNNVIGSGANGGDTSYHGDLTAVRRWYNQNGQYSYQDTTYTYDPYGNRLTETRWNSFGTGTQIATSDPRATTTVYDPTYHTFATSVTNALNQVTSVSYDPKLGKLLSKTDPNHATTSYQYDGFGRIVAVWAPTEDASQLGAATVLVSYQASANQPFRIQIGRRKDGGGGLFARRSYEWRFYDGLGRLIQTQADFSRAGMAIHAQDVNEVRGGISADGVTPAVGAVTAGASVIQASDFTGLRGNIQTLWANAGLGSVPGWSSGVTPGGPSLGTTKTPIYGSDVVDLRQWLNLYESAAGKALTGWTYGAGQVIVVNKLYDARGLLQAQTVSHLMTLNVPGQFDGGDWASGSSPKTSHSYDALKRSLTRVQPDGQATFRWSYNGFATTTTDENGHQKTQTTDALGRLKTVQEVVSGNTSTTSYGYDVADRLLTVSDAAGNQTTITYDSLGRKTGLADPDLGSWQYAYPASPTTSNPLWLVQTQTDAKGQAISYQYDLLDRITGKSGNGLAVSYGYDAGTNGIGRRTSMRDGAGTASYGYDARGRLTSLTRTITGMSYQPITTSYDAQDRPLSISFPNGDALAYVYGDHGMPVSLTLNGSPLVSNATYNALKKVGALPLGNGLQTTWQYFGIDVQASVANRWYGLPAQVQTGSLQSQSFATTNGYDLVGNPTALSYADHTGESLGFGYNELDQILGMSGAASESYGNYLQGTADLGNLLASREGSYGYPAAGQAHPHAPSSVSAVGSYGYDANGNRQSDPTYAYSYDIENHLTQLSQGGSTVLQNTYDGDGNRLARVAGGTTTHYVGDWYEFDPNANVATVYYPFNGQAVAMKQGSTLYYLHRDQVGSVVSISSASGNEVGSLRYWPFGGVRSSTGTLSTDRLFTGQIRDLGDDRLYYFQARYYDATIGKFQTADTIVPSSKNPQALNRYSYALNDPLKFADPSGHDPWDPNWVAAFQQKNGRPPGQQDWDNYQFSLTHPGSGPGGSWTDQDWQNYSQLQRRLGLDTSGSGTFTVWSAPDLHETFEGGTPWWVVALLLAPKPHAGGMVGSLDVSPDESVDRVRISLTLTASEGGIDFDPKYRLWVRSASGQLIPSSPQELQFQRPSRGARLFWTDALVSGGPVWGASIYANASTESGMFPSGEIDLGFGNWPAPSD